MAISEEIKDKRDYIIEWLTPELKVLPVSVKGEEDQVLVLFQSNLICGLAVEEEAYRIFNASDDWKEKTTYHCEQAEDGTWFYYVETVEECIEECKRLVILEAKKDSGGSNDEEKDSIVSKYWLEKTQEVIGDIPHVGDFFDDKGKKKILFECYGKGPKSRMRIYLNPATARQPEIVSIWVGVRVLSPNKINPTMPGAKKKVTDGVETNVKINVSSSNRESDMERIYAFIRDIMSRVGSDKATINSLVDG